jgi:hypothetical protein
MLFQIPTFLSGSVLTSLIACRKMNSSRLVSGLSTPKMHTDQSVLSPRLLHGETTQGFMTADFKPARAASEPFSHDHQSARQIRLLL